LPLSSDSKYKELTKRIGPRLKERGSVRDAVEFLFIPINHGGISPASKETCRAMKAKSGVGCEVWPSKDGHNSHEAIIQQW
jgi:hypothetical protein